MENGLKKGLRVSGEGADDEVEEEAAEAMKRL